MKALVTGGGFIGSNVCKKLLENGDDFIVVDSLVTGYAENLQFCDSDRLHRVDIRDRERLAQLFQGIDTVFHLAASVGNKRSIDAPHFDAEINVLGTVTVMELARQAGVKRVVVSSSAGTFGELKTLPISENHAVEPDTPYGASKLFKEKFCLSYGNLYDMDVVALRYFNVYGPNQRFDAYGNVIPIFAYKLLRGEKLKIYGDGNQTRDFIHVDDVSRANYLAASVDGANGAFNLGSGTRITINELVDILQKISGLKADIEYVSRRPGDVMHSMADISKIRDMLGFRVSVDITDGLIEYIEWLKFEIDR